MSLLNGLAGNVAGTSQFKANVEQEINNSENSNSDIPMDIIAKIDEQTPLVRFGLWTFAAIFSVVTIVGIPLAVTRTIPKTIISGISLIASVFTGTANKKPGASEPIQEQPQESPLTLTPVDSYFNNNYANSVSATYLLEEGANSFTKKEETVVLLEAETNREVDLMKSAMSALGNGSATADLSNMDTTGTETVLLAASNSNVSYF